MPRAFVDQVAVITGASSGIGRALAEVLAAQGCRVGLISRRLDSLHEVADHIRSHGGIAEPAAADVGDRSQVLEAVGRVVRTLGPVELMIANAGVGIPTLLSPLNVSDVEKTFRVNVLGVIYAFESVMPSMLERRRGHLAAVSSLAAYKGLPGESAYCASKAAVNSYLEGLRIQLRDRGIRVTTLCPGFVRTAMTAMNQFHMPWLMDAESAARRMALALNSGKKVYDFPWQMALFTKATRWLPDWVIARTMASYNEAPPIPADRSS